MHFKSPILAFLFGCELAIWFVFRYKDNIGRLDKAPVNRGDVEQLVLCQTGGRYELLYLPCIGVEVEKPHE